MGKAFGASPESPSSVMHTAHMYVPLRHSSPGRRVRCTLRLKSPAWNTRLGASLPVLNFSKSSLKLAYVREVRAPSGGWGKVNYGGEPYYKVPEVGHDIVPRWACV